MYRALVTAFADISASFGFVTPMLSFLVLVPYYFDMYVESVTLEYAAVGRGVFIVSHLASSPQGGTCR